jgi:hypothetical protein
LGAPLKRGANKVAAATASGAFVRIWERNLCAPGAFVRIWEGMGGYLVTIYW